MKKLNNIIEDYELIENIKLTKFINDNPENLQLSELSKVVEKVNNNRVDRAAYYTDDIVLNHIEQHLPDIKQDNIRILEPSAGSGNYIQLIINKYSSETNHLIIDVNDIDENSININKMLNKYRNIPQNVTINYSCVDYLSPFYFNDIKYDLVIGNPPFLKLSKKNGLEEYSNLFSDNITKNLAGFFLQKALNHSEYVSFIMPKYFLHNTDFEQTRNLAKNFHIETILDFGEVGFKGVLIETIAIFIDTVGSSKYTLTKSISKEKNQEILQSKLTDPFYPNWLLYRNSWFDDISQKMKFDVFTAHRDRQITNAVLKESGDVRVLKSRNIKRDGSGIQDMENYDAYIDSSVLSKFTISKYLENDDVYLSPNMTYYPRVIQKPKNVIVNGSIAILTNKNKVKIDNKHLKFLSSDTFEKFYAIARNLSTRSLNIDKNSVFYFGLYNE